MSLNISDAETCRMADELARLTGETTTGAVTIALREQLERERRKRDAAGKNGHERCPLCWRRGRPLDG